MDYAGAAGRAVFRVAGFLLRDSQAFRGRRRGVVILLRAAVPASAVADVGQLDSLVSVLDGHRVGFSDHRTVALFACESGSEAAFGSGVRCVGGDGGRAVLSKLHESPFPGCVCGGVRSALRRAGTLETGAYRKHGVRTGVTATRAISHCASTQARIAAVLSIRGDRAGVSWDIYERGPAALASGCAAFSFRRGCAPSNLTDAATKSAAAGLEELGHAVRGVADLCRSVGARRQAAQLYRTRSGICFSGGDGFPEGRNPLSRSGGSGDGLLDGIWDRPSARADGDG